MVYVTLMSDKSESLGELEALVLLAVMRCDGEAYGIPVREEIRRAGRSVTLGTVYKTLTRLESKGLLVTSVSDPRPGRGGRRRKLYELTPAGTRALRSMLARLAHMARDLSLPLGAR